MLLDAKAMVGSIPTTGEFGSEAAIARFFNLWSAVVRQIRQTPYYPVRHVADILEQTAPTLGTDERFRPLADAVDELISERVGAGAAAERARRRSIAHLNAGNYIAAIDELQKARIGWFSGETMDASILAMLVISQSYSELNLHYAARYYAAGALFIAFRHENERLKRRIPHAAFRLADTFMGAGEGITFLHSVGDALNAHDSLASDPYDWTKHDDVARIAAQGMVVRAVARRLAPSLLPLIESAIDGWPLTADELTRFREIADGPPWTTMSAEEVEQKIAEELGQNPFSDIGPRTIVWSALGINWTITSDAQAETWLAVLEVATALQIAQVEFGAADLVVVPSHAHIRVALDREACFDVQQEPDNGRLSWNVIMPREDAGQTEDWPVRLASIAITIIGQTTALPYERFQNLVKERIERGFNVRLFSVRPIRELMAFSQPSRFDFDAALRTPRAYAKTFEPICAPELKWRDGPGPGYSLERARELLQNRYKNAAASIRFTLPRLLSDLRCRALIQQMRHDGLLDWQILGITASIVTQSQIQAKFPNMDPRRLGREMTNRIYRAERDDDPAFDLAAFSDEAVDVQKKLVAVAALRTWGLEIHRQTPDFDAIKRLLDSRYNHSSDDIPHDDLLPSAA